MSFCLWVLTSFFFYSSRLSTLLKEIMSEKDNKTIVFIETKKRVDDITWKMKKDGWPAESIHGDKSQKDRESVLQGNYLIEVRNKDLFFEGIG